MENSVTDAELMLRFQQGDREAFDKIVLRHQVDLFNFFYRLMGDRHAAEDHTQEVFLRLVLHADTYEPLAKFTTYLYRIARNCWIDSQRRHKRQHKVQSLDQTLRNHGDGEKAENLYDRLAASSDDPAAALEQSRQQTLVEEALAHLPEELQIVVVLSEVKGMKYADIAETLDIPLGTVKSRMHTAMQRLREYLETKGGVRTERR